MIAIKYGAKAASINRIFDKYLKSKGLDAHKIKQYHLGRGDIAKYNLYVGKNTREVLIYRKGGGKPIKTGGRLD